ncbi:Glycosyl transferase WecB/TagA/CpsF family protein [Alkalispirochaeta americana]|uniref:Glycosyl transferase WecB/TagA/CpsF family protein n=1 Tax=Alkalispirochaeta americana TaxID=159291 RepID=A0A1N6RZV5_9SPIO|nr:WecB/TagA/CpsF family glycosyltransferase [Alkalispirochaeta americana]SIQ34394.1 Glycosyl transferase WecB/TagA/CpsF family protein [Alkalispirochaeta americana]
MSCTFRQFFGLPLIEDAPPDLAPVWGATRTAPGILFFAGRSFLWRLVRSRRVRTGLAGKNAAVVPAGGGARWQTRLACGCDIGKYSAFQGLIRLLSRAEEDQAAIFIVDSDPKAVRRIEENLRITFPGLRIVGRAAFTPAIATSVTTAIRKAEPRIVLIGCARKPVLRWMIGQYDQVGNALAIVASQAVDRMAGRRRGISPGDLLGAPLQLLVPLLLVGHRLVLIHRWKKLQA